MLAVYCTRLLNTLYVICMYVSMYILLVGPMDFTWKHEESTKDMKVVALIQYTYTD
jgi:flagellar biosynthesis protein FlhB